MPSSDNTPAPAFCPNPSCEFHLNPTGWKFKKAGFYTRQIHPQRIQRYRCTRCQKNFSSQTFSITYWLKQPELLESVYHGILSCSAYRQMARFLGVSPNTIMGQVERLGRHCLLLHQWLRPKHAPVEPIVVDGFETFEFSQYFPHHINLAVGAHSHFRYAFTEAELRRKGRTTAAQKSVLLNSIDGSDDRTPKLSSSP